MGDVGKARMRAIHAESERLLNVVAALFPPEYKLTLLCRHDVLPDADVLLTVDDLLKVEEAIARLRVEANVHQSPGSN